MTITPFVLGVLCCLAAEGILIFLTSCIGYLIERAKRKPLDAIIEMAKMMEENNERTGE